MSERSRSPGMARAEFIAHLCTPLAIVWAILQSGCDASRARDDRRFEIYNQINDQYVQFLEVCVRHPWVDCFDKTDAEGVRAPNTAEERRIEGAVFAALISMLERAYVFYQQILPTGDDMVINQWPGWEEYARSFATRDRFKVHWALLASEFDLEFRTWMNGLVAPGQGSPRK